MVRGALGTAPRLSYEDAQAIAENINGVEGVAPQIATWAQVIAKGKNISTRIKGVTPNYEFVRNYTVSEGRFITERDLNVRERIAVLGSRVVDELFGGESPVGRDIRIGRFKFRVVGVLESREELQPPSLMTLSLYPLPRWQEEFIGEELQGGNSSSAHSS